MKRYGDVKVMF